MISVSFIFRHLPIKEASDIPDPYVKLYMLPKKENNNTKRKTEVSSKQNEWKKIIKI